MPIIHFQGKTIHCEPGATLRNELLKNGLRVHNGKAKYFNCRGFGTCGTCAVKIEGEVHALTEMEKWRLKFPPHKANSGLRLACQVKVMDNLYVIKHGGFWGEKSH